MNFSNGFLTPKTRRASRHPVARRTAPIARRATPMARHTTPQKHSSHDATQWIAARARRRDAKTCRASRVARRARDALTKIHVIINSVCILPAEHSM